MFPRRTDILQEVHNHSLHHSRSGGACVVSVSISLIAVGLHKHKGLMNEQRFSCRDQQRRKKKKKVEGLGEKTHGC